MLEAQCKSSIVDLTYVNHDRRKSSNRHSPGSPRLVSRKGIVTRGSSQSICPVARRLNHTGALGRRRTMAKKKAAKKKATKKAAPKKKATKKKAAKKK